MAGRKKPKAQRSIESYEHRDKERVNNPPAGLVTPQTDPDAGQQRKTYAYDPHLDPQLVWSNRLIAGDSLLVMNSLLEKEGMAGKVQMIYIDPPYGIKRDVKDGRDEDLTSEPPATGRCDDFGAMK